MQTPLEPAVGGAHRPPDRGGAGPRARARRGPPRRQAVQHPPRSATRPRTCPTSGSPSRPTRRRASRARRATWRPSRAAASGSARPPISTGWRAPLLEVLGGGSLARRAATRRSPSCRCAGGAAAGARVAAPPTDPAARYPVDGGVRGDAWPPSISPAPPRPCASPSPPAARSRIRGRAAPIAPRTPSGPTWCAATSAARAGRVRPPRAGASRALPRRRRARRSRLLGLRRRPHGWAISTIPICCRGSPR